MIVLLGLYNSGSSAIAGMLHHLGVNMCPPYWVNSRPKDPENHFEPYEFSWHLRHWWQEPKLEELIPRPLRLQYMQHWLRLQQVLSRKPMGVKHPLLALMLDDIREAWGEVQLLWCWRSLEDSIAGLQRRGWFTGHEVVMQTKLWEVLNQVPDLPRIEWEAVKSDPMSAVARLSKLAGISPTTEQIAHAVEHIRW